MRQSVWGYIDMRYTWPGWRCVLRSPGFYGTVYFICIPLFAFIYWYFFSGSFYAPYAKLEAAAKSDVRNAGAILDSALHRTMARSNRTVEAEGWQFEDFRITDVSATDMGGIHFSILFRLSRPVKGNDWPQIAPADTAVGRAILQTTVRANMPGGGRLRFEQAPGFVVFYRTIFIETNEELLGRDHVYRAVYSYLTSPTSVDKARLVLLSPENNDRLDSLFRGLRGDPIEISGGFWRMMYFSATVITTIGFGDIVPMSPGARLAAAIEGVLGIVFAGLFVNAATRRRARGTVTHSAPSAPQSPRPQDQG